MKETEFKPFDDVETPDGYGFVMAALGGYVKVKLYRVTNKRLAVRGSVGNRPRKDAAIQVYKARLVKRAFKA